MNGLKELVENYINELNSTIDDCEGSSSSNDINTISQNLIHLLQISSSVLPALEGNKIVPVSYFTLYMVAENRLHVKLKYVPSMSITLSQASEAKLTEEML